jgi:hypothetical protein
MGIEANEIDPGLERDASDAPEVDPRSAETLMELLPNGTLTRCEVAEWVYLNEGERVVVQRAGMHPKAGNVDTISNDAYVFWVSLEHGQGRIMISAQESVRVWKFPIW